MRFSDTITLCIARRAKGSLPVDNDVHAVCNSRMDSLKAAIEHAGGMTKFAAALGVSVQRLSNWLDRGVPAERCPDIELASKGLARCEALRPDVNWHVLRNSAPQPRQQVEEAQCLTS